MFKRTDPQTAAFVRVPAINYLRACPPPRAKTLVEELRKIDPSTPKIASSEEQYAIAGQAASATSAGRLLRECGFRRQATPVAAKPTMRDHRQVHPSRNRSSETWHLLVAGAAIGEATLLAMVVRGKAKPVADVDPLGRIVLSGTKSGKMGGRFQAR